ncbi:hypothetical protein PoB_003378300 [Plakobranchus ocellatus]|uniref:Uncharacterized protein n=1 Tax=Plakobranchus ocellatus TaxID=259542 RepID=A0AAV4AKG9_9GAST|nr:hypothetical protein PoB_003378300 [Plakobranchus ocellatus]
MALCFSHVLMDLSAYPHHKIFRWSYCALYATISSRFKFLYIASSQQGDLGLSGPPSGQDAGGEARTRDRRVPADLRADSQATVLPTPQYRPKCFRTYMRKTSLCWATKIVIIPQDLA